MVNPKFEIRITHLPVNLQQFQDLTNELLTEFNKIAAPQALDGDYMAQVVHAAIHGLDRTEGTVDKYTLFDRCVNMVSKHVTYHAIQEIEARMKAKKEAEKTETPVTDNVVPIGQEPA